MSEFRVANGHIRIADDEVKIEQNPITGLIRYYRERKKFTIIFTSIWTAYLIILFATDIVGYAIRFIFVFVTLLVPGIILAEKAAGALNKQQIDTLQKSSIKQVKHKKFSTLNIGRISIEYSENGEDNLRNVWVSFLSKTNGGRIGKAMDVIESEGIPTDRERSSNKDQNTDNAAN